MEANSQGPKVNTFEKIKDLHSLISEGHKRIGDQKEEEAVLILGETGAGKSTLTYLFAGKDLQAAQTDEGYFIIEAIEQLEGIKIGLDKVSETKIPTKIKTQSGCVIWDCPGFADLGRDDIQDIANAFYIQRLFDTTKKLKFVLAIPEYDMMGKGADLLRVVTHFVKIFREIEDITCKNSVFLVVTQASPGKTPEHFKRTIEKILEQNSSLEGSNKKMLGYLLNSIEVFHKPVEIGLIKKPLTTGSSNGGNSILHTIEINTKYLESKPGSANVVISRSSVELADELFNKSSQAFLGLIIKVTAKIKAICDKVNGKGDNITGLSKLFQSHSYNIAKRHYKELLNLESIQAFHDFCSSALKKEPAEQWLTLIDERLNDVISILEQYSQDANKAEILILECETKENLKYMRFLSKVYDNKKVNLGNSIKIFGECKAAIEEASLKGAESIQLEPFEKSLDYYQKAIRFLGPYSNNSKCQEITAEAYYYIAVIKESEGNFTDAIKYCIQALEIKAKFQDPLDLIDAICINDNSQLKNFQLKKLFGFSYSSKTHGDLLNYLKEKNDSFFLQILCKIKALINTALEVEICDKRFKLMEFIDNLSTVLSIMLSTINKKDTSIIQFGKSIIQIAEILCPATSKDLLLQLNLLAKYLNDLGQKDLPKTLPYMPSKIDIWVSYMDIEKAANVLCDRIKSLELQNGDLPYYEKLINYTNFKIKVQTQKQKESFVVNLKQDPICKSNRALAHLEIGRIKQSQQCYSETLDYCIKAIEINENLEEAYRQLDDIYFISGAIVTRKDIAKRLLRFNIDECFRILNERLMKFFQDYITDRKYFSQVDKSHLSYLDHLDNLNPLCDIFNYLKTPCQDMTEFFANLNKMSVILAKDAIHEKIKREIGKSKKLRCELIDEAEGLFVMNILEKQLRYIEKLSSNQDNLISISHWRELFDSSQLEERKKSYVQSIKMFSQEDWSSDDCLRVISHVKSYDSDKVCVTINIQSHLRLAEKTKTKEEEIECYQKLIELDGKLLELCKEQDKAFYSAESIKKHVCDKLGDIYLDTVMINDAIEQFKLVGNHLKIKKCFDRLINSDENNYTFREQKGDYLSEQGMIDSAVDSYLDALSLTKDSVICERINKRISNVLESGAAKSEEFKRKAQEIATTQLVIS